LLVLIKVVHTLVWALFAGCIFGVFAAAHAGNLRLALVLIAIVAVEVAVLVANQLRCPLTAIAARHTQDRAENFDIYLPRWLAKYNKEIFGPLYALGIAYTAIKWLS